jgi:hypothetical protein
MTYRKNKRKIFALASPFYRWNIKPKINLPRQALHPEALPLIFRLSFLIYYLAKGCVLDGADGVLTSMNHAHYTFM